MHYRTSLILLTMFLIGTPQLLVAQMPSSSKEKLSADLLDAAASGQIGKVLDLISTGADVNAKNKWGETALMLAAQHGRAEAVKILIEAKADMNAKSESGYTALMLAAMNGRTEAVKALIEAKADVSAKDKGGHTALMFAAEHSHIGIVDLLKSAVDKN